MKLYLVRHAESEANRGNHTGKDPVLSETGVEQAKRLGMYFRKKKINKIYCSKMTRAKQTLKEIKEYLPNVPIEYTKKINEKSKGIYEHQEERFNEALKKSGLKWHEFRPPQGENLKDVEKRAQLFRDFLYAAHKNDHVLIVSHGYFLRVLINRIFKFHIREIKYFELSNASVSYFEFDKKLNLVDYEIDDFKHILKYSSYSREIREK